MSSVPEKHRLISDLFVVNSELRLSDDNDYDSKKTNQQEIKFGTKKNTLKSCHAKQKLSFPSWECLIL